MTDIKNGPWTIHSTHTGFENPWVRVDVNEVTHPDGALGEYSVVRHASLACGVLPIDEEGYTWLVGQHRFPFDAYSWELPEGGGAKTVEPHVSALRELEEEAGWAAEHYLPIGKWHLSNSVTDEVAYGFLAWGLRYVGNSPDPTEVLEIKRVHFSDLLTLLRGGEITDAFTHLMVMSAFDMARRGDLPPDLAKHLVSG